MCKKKLKNALILFLFGAILGPWADSFHTHVGVLSYYRVVFFQMAWWVPLLFGIAAVVIGFTHISLDDRFAMQPKPRNWVEIIWGLGLFLMIYKLSALLPNSGIKLFLLGFLSVTTWYLLDRRVLGLVQALLTAVFGTVVEMTLIKFKFFFYQEPDLFGVPLWLPFIYIAASVAVGNLARKLTFNSPR